MRGQCPALCNPPPRPVELPLGCGLERLERRRAGGPRTLPRPGRHLCGHPGAILGPISVTESDRCHFQSDGLLLAQPVRGHTVVLTATHPLPAPRDRSAPGNLAPGVCTPDPLTLPPAWSPPPCPILPSPTADSAGMPRCSCLLLEGPQVCPGTRTPLGFRRSLCVCSPVPGPAPPVMSAHFGLEHPVPSASSCCWPQPSLFAWR